MKNVKFCTLAAFNGSHVALSQHVLSFFAKLCGYLQSGKKWSTYFGSKSVLLDLLWNIEPMKSEPLRIIFIFIRQMAPLFERVQINWRMPIGLHKLRYDQERLWNIVRDSTLVFFTARR